MNIFVYGCLALGAIALIADLLTARPKTPLRRAVQGTYVTLGIVGLAAAAFVAWLNFG